MAKETKCDNCGTDINTADVFEEAIHAQVHMCQQAGLDPMEVIIRGLRQQMNL